MMMLKPHRYALGGLCLQMGFNHKQWAGQELPNYAANATKHDAFVKDDVALRVRYVAPRLDKLEMIMDVSMEIRKLPYSNLKELAQILELNESWKRLMAIIPKVLEKNNYACNLSIQNPHKYHSEHFRLLENASKTMQKMCAEILFSEWGTSGRVRPALGHLLHLLTKAELYRAADYVAVALLKREPPERPLEGPAAAVNVAIPDPCLLEVERMLDAMNYPESVISNLLNNSRDINLNYSSTRAVGIVPEIVISEPEPDKSSAIEMPMVLESRRKRMQRQDASLAEEAEVSDMIKFSVGLDNTSDSDNQSSDCLPNLSALNISAAQAQSQQNVPALSILVDDNVPHLSDLLQSDLLSTAEENQNIEIPNLSILNIDDQSELLPQVSLLINDEEQSSSNNAQTVPQLSVLLPEKGSCSSTDLKHFLPIIEFGSDTSSFTSSNSSHPSSELSRNSNLSRPMCISPLPNLHLNTPLPHFTYCEVEAATNNFDETPHKNCRQVENSLAVTNGRFLGSGAFGSVFLALNIADKPVAVKKLFLNNMDVVDVDDPVTKQFKNEVEVLSKYKHENLLSLVGYSCDGPTYCLLYEFMPGGALKDRLQNVEEKLIWTDRLYIGLGTARAISYLHTAYSTPLIHRDIKTANILLDCTNKPKLCDFGLIKLIPNQNTNTSTSAFGTSAYMAREAFRGDVSVKLDTYSFGVVLLELITGLPPLDENREGCDIVTHVEEVCEDDGIDPLIDLKAGSWVVEEINFAEELYKIAVKCLEQNKKKRPTMVEVKEELGELIKQCG